MKGQNALNKIKLRLHLQKIKITHKRFRAPKSCLKSEWIWYVNTLPNLAQVLEDYSASPQARPSRMPTHQVVLMLGIQITMEKYFASAATGQKLKEQF